MRTIGSLIFPGFELLDLFGPMEMFGLLEDKFSLQLVAEKAGSVASNQGLAASVAVSYTHLTLPTTPYV